MDPEEQRIGFCPACGGVVAPGDRFCPSCGSATDRVILPAVDMAQVEYMGFWVRLAAYLIDSILLLVPFLVVSRFGAPWLIYVIALVYAVLFIGLKGQTPGKMAMGIQVVDERGQVPGIARAVLREVVGKFISALPIYLGYFWVGWDRRKRGWHDYIGRTYVIRKPSDRR